MGYSDASDYQRDSFWDINEWNLDKAVKPHVMVRGIMGKTSAAEWNYLLAENSRIMISGTLPAAASSPLSADSSSISAKQGDAANLRMSAFQIDAANLMVSGKSGDAALFRVSAIGGTAGDNVIVDGTDQSISAKLVQVSAAISSNSNAVITYAQNRDSAAQFRISAFQDGAASLNVSAKSNDGALLRVSAVQDGAATLNVSAKSNDGALLRTSAIQGDAGLQLVSAKQGDAGLLLVSGKQGDAALFRTSAIQGDAGVQRTSAVQGDANNQHVSSVQGDAGLLRVSADLFGDTTGGLTTYNSLNLSASQAIKATAGALYGYYLYNSDTIYNYIKMYNTSGAINVGTDTPVLTIGIPPSAAANIEFPHGLKGFTAGIGVAALSAIAHNATTAAKASAVGGNFFYV